ncbi:hypothetical protein II898_11520 [bacterium]|nr:hypothetical protein [bacterium]
MKKTIFFIMFFLFAAAVSAEEPRSEESVSPTIGTKPEKEFNTELKFGFGLDFTGNIGTHPLMKAFLQNQFGVSVGLDLHWKIFEQTSGEGAGELFLGFGSAFQYWVPTTEYTPEVAWSSYDYYDKNYITMHYMRIPVTLNILYNFKVDAGVLKRVGPSLSIGFNNNLVFFDYSSENEETMEEYEEDYDKNFHHWKLGGTWAIGMNFLFDNDWFFRTSIGGDFGNGNRKSYLFFHDSEENKAGAYGYFLYGHHEFMMFETGYRF